MHNETCSLLKPNNHYGQGQILSSKYRFMQESLIITTTSHSSDKKHLYQELKGRSHFTL
jgi:hypothetical protein